MLAKKFRPVDLSPRFTIKKNLIMIGNSRVSYNWQNYDRDWWPAVYQINHKTLSKQYMRLHYLAAHAPKSVRQRWFNAYRGFKRRHFANPRRASSQFIDKHTAERWL